jgi:hypothetical protein
LLATELSQREWRCVTLLLYRENLTCAQSLILSSQQSTTTTIGHNNNNNNNKGLETTDEGHTHTHTHTHHNQYVNMKMILCYGIKRVHTGREVTVNRPDIIIKSKKEKTCVLIDVAIPADRNVTQKEAEKKLKYESLCIQI